MELKRAKQALTEADNRSQLRFRLVVRTVLFTILGALLLGIGLLRQLAPHRSQQLRLALTQLPGELKRHIGSWNTQVPHLSLDIGHLKMEQLARERNQVLLGGQLKDFSFVSADIRWGANSYPVKVRLKGDRHLHFSDHHRWSFRVHVKDEHSIAGMKYFSLHRAGARNYLHEWLYHRLLDRESLVALRYEFCRLSLNGADLGIYALEEHFDKRLLEHRQYREGPILKFEESLSGDNLNLSWVHPFREDQWQDSSKRAILALATQQLEAFKSGAQPLSAVVDLPKMGRFLAISDLLSVYHASLWKSMRFYFNPITAKLEPIGFDGHFQAELAPVRFSLAEVGLRPEIGFFDGHASWFRWLFAPHDTLDSALFQAYSRELEAVSQPDFITTFLQEIQPELGRNQQILQSEFPSQADHLYWYGPDMYHFDEQSIFDKAQYLQELLHPAKARLLVYRGEYRPRSLHVSLLNLHSLPLEITSLQWGEKQFVLPKRIILPAASPSDQPTFAPTLQSASMGLPAELVWHDSMWQEIQLGHQVLGIQDSMQARVLGWERNPNGRPFLPPPLQPANLDEFPFLEVDEVNKIILFPRGEHVISQAMYLPTGYVVRIEAGCRIRFVDQGSLLTYSPLIGSGTEAQPIYISGEGKNGQGILVLQTKAPSYLEQVIFEGLTPPKEGGWSMSGGVTFYESEAHFRQVSWLRNKGEDALNLVRSRFSLTHCQFQEIESDALDIDFGVGEIEGCWFDRSGNDAIDLSGSQVQIIQTQIRHAGDKGISIGEGSQVEVQALSLNNCRVGVAVKDLSRLQGSNFQLDSCGLGLAVYQKKAEFGGAEATIKAWQNRHSQEDILVEMQSSAQINEISIRPTATALASKLEAALINK